MKFNHILGMTIKDTDVEAISKYKTKMLVI